ncbi:MAG: glycosyltransferase [Lentisphaeria bacterium]|nr:glycosyltransferase [Lentisphaeria bacterium]
MSTLSVIIPCYNESRRLQPLLALIDGNAPLGWEWVFVDDGSSDGTGDKLKAFAERTAAGVSVLRHDRNRGKGAAVRTGMLAASGQCAAFVDADLAASPLDFAPLLEEPDLLEGRVMYIGTRRSDRCQRRLLRALAGRAYRLFACLITGLRVGDTQCAFKILATQQAKEIFGQMRSEGYAFDAELMMLATRRIGMEIREIPIDWEEQPGSRIRPWHVWHMAREVLAMRRNNPKCE